METLTTIWAYTWRIALGVAGLVVLRQAIYAKVWGHGRWLRTALGVLAGAALVVPALRFNLGTQIPMAVLGILLGIPYRALVIRIGSRSTRRGLMRLAATRGTQCVEEEDELFGFRTEGLWAGNVITHVRSLHPGVRTQQRFYMLAFSVPLTTEPPFCASMMKGWQSPKYHERQWRTTTVMQGAMMSLSLGALREGGEVTGSDVADLANVSGLVDERFEGLNVMASDAEAFAATFEGEMLEPLFASAYSVLQYEMNVTKTCVNIYTTYCGPAVQQRHVEFLETLARRLSEPGKAPAPPVAPVKPQV